MQSTAELLEDYHAQGFVVLPDRVDESEVDALRRALQPYLDLEIEAPGLEPGSVDLAITALDFHDIVDGEGPERMADFLTAVHEILAPDGVFGIIDLASSR